MPFSNPVLKDYIFIILTLSGLFQIYNMYVTAIIILYSQLTVRNTLRAQPI